MKLVLLFRVFVLLMCSCRTLPLHAIDHWLPCKYHRWIWDGSRHWKHSKKSSRDVHLKPGGAQQNGLSLMFSGSLFSARCVCTIRESMSRRTSSSGSPCFFERSNRTKAIAAPGEGCETKDAAPVGNVNETEFGRCYTWCILSAYLAKLQACLTATRLASFASSSLDDGSPGKWSSAMNWYNHKESGKLSV